LLHGGGDGFRWAAADPLRVPSGRSQQRRTPNHHSKRRSIRRHEEGSDAGANLPGASGAMKRRELLAMPALLAAAPSTDARIDDVQVSFQDFLYRAPYMFGGKEVDRVTLLHVRCHLSTRGGKSAEG